MKNRIFTLETLSKAKKSKGLRNSIASLFAFATAIIWAFASIPLAVAYLEREQIGLWAIINVFITYLTWADMGIGRSAGRLLAKSVSNHDKTELDQWWSLLKFALWALAIAFIFISVIAAYLIPKALGIDNDLQGKATALLVIVSLTTCLSFPIRCNIGLLIAQERYHWIPIIEASALVVNLATFYAGLRLGYGINAYVIAVAFTQLMIICSYVLLIRFGPHRPTWNSQGINYNRGRLLFKFSGSIAIAGISDSITRTLPNLFLGKLSGLSSIPTYNFTSKPAIMSGQIVSRIYQSFYPGMQSAFVCGDLESFKSKYGTVGRAVIGLSISASCGILLLNETIVHLLSNDTFFAGMYANTWFAIGVTLYVSAEINRSLLTVSGNMSKYGLVSIGKCLLAVALAGPAIEKYGLAGIAMVFNTIWIVDIVYGFFVGNKNARIKAREVTLPLLAITCAGITVIGATSLCMAKIDQSSEQFSLLGKSIFIPGTLDIAVCVPGMLFGLSIFFSALFRISRPNPKSTNA